MVAHKKKRTDLEVPQWVKDQWAMGTHQREEMAACLQEANFNKDSYPTKYHQTPSNGNSALSLWEHVLCTSRLGRIPRPSGESHQEEAFHQTHQG